MGEQDKQKQKSVAWVYAIVAIMGLSVTLGLGAMVFARRNHFFYFVFYYVKSLLLFLSLAHIGNQGYTILSHKGQIPPPEKVAEMGESVLKEVGVGVTDEKVEEAVEKFREESLS